MSGKSVEYKKTIRNLVDILESMIGYLEKNGLWKQVVPKDETRAQIRRVVYRAKDVLERRS